MKANIDQIELTIKVVFSRPLTVEEARLFVQEMDYSVTQSPTCPKGHVIIDTEVVADDVDDYLEKFPDDDLPSIEG